MAAMSSGLGKTALSLLALGLAVSAAAGPAAEPDDQVRAWLQRMSAAIESLNYRGTLVHWREGQVDTLRIIHRADPGGSRERIYSLDGEPREILRDGGEVRCLLTGDSSLLVRDQLSTRLLPNLPVERLGGEQAAYVKRLGGHERVAGLNAQIVEILPADEFRYGHRFWLETESGMLLRSALLDQHGRRLQQLSFVSLELDASIADAELEPTLGANHERLNPVWPETLSLRVEASPDAASWLPERLPPGFSLARVGRGDGVGGPVFEHLLFSDGLASFSIYIEQAGVGNVPSTLESMGPVHMYSRVTDGRQITIIGEVPSATVTYVGLALSPALGGLRQD